MGPSGRHIPPNGSIPLVNGSLLNLKREDSTVPADTDAVVGHVPEYFGIEAFLEDALVLLRFMVETR